MTTLRDAERHPSDVNSMLSFSYAFVETERQSNDGEVL